MPTFQSHGAEVYYETVGSGRPLLLIAGTASDGASWAPLTPLLADRFQVILIDNRGSGRTRCAGALQVEDMVDDCAALLAHLGVGRTDVVGHSLGGAIAAWFAVRHADRANRVVTMGFGPLSRQARALFKDLALLYPQVSPQLYFRLLFQFLFKPGFFEDSEAVSAAANASTAYPFRQSPADFARQVAALDTVEHYNIGAIAAPTLAMAGELDLICNPEQVFAVHRRIANLKTVTIKGAAHSMHWDDTDAVAEAILSFLA